MSATYKKVDRATLSGWKAELREWTTPVAFSNQVDRMMDQTADALFKQGGVGFLRDAWVAARVAIIMSATRVRLCAGDYPDFELKNGEIQRFEVTEADMPGRRRGDESFETEEDPVEQWRQRFEAIPAAMNSVISKKLKKKYQRGGTSLVVYVNLGSYGAYVDEGLPTLAQLTEPAKDVFEEVLVYWEGVLYRFWKAGRHNFAKWLIRDLGIC